MFYDFLGPEFRRGSSGLFYYMLHLNALTWQYLTQYSGKTATASLKCLVLGQRWLVDQAQLELLTRTPPHASLNWQFSEWSDFLHRDSGVPERVSQETEIKSCQFIVFYLESAVHHFYPILLIKRDPNSRRGGTNYTSH